MIGCLYDTDKFGCACSRSDHHGKRCTGTCRWHRTEVAMNPAALNRWIRTDIDEKPDKERDDDTER